MLDEKLIIQKKKLFYVFLQKTNYSKVSRGNKLKVIIVGAGEVGYHVASRLSLENKEVIVIDSNETSLSRVTNNLDVQAILGSGNSPNILKQAGIENAELLLATTDKDETNLSACLMAHILSPGIKKLARVRASDFDQYHQRLKDEVPYINAIINPEAELVNTITSLMEVPNSIEVKEFADGKLKFIGLNIDDSSELVGIKLINYPKIFKNKSVPLIGAIARNGEIIVPDGKSFLMSGDIAYFIYPSEQFQSILKYFNENAKTVRKAIVIGGGSTGKRIASKFSQNNIYTKIIEKDLKRCEKLAEDLDNIIVLHGDGSDRALLMEENIQNYDLVVTLTGNDETNILLSLLSKKLGVVDTITKINNFNYFNLLPQIGIAQTVSAKLSAIDSILQYTRTSNVLSAITISQEQAEVFEVVINEKSKICGKQISNAKIPQNAIIISMLKNNEIIVPDGKTIFEAEDKIVILALKSAIAKLEKLLTVKKSFL